MKKLGKALLFPPLPAILLLIAASAYLLVRVMLAGETASVGAICSYVLSFYTLVTAVLYGIFRLPGQYRAIRQRINDHPLGNRLMTDRVFRTTVTLYASLAVNLCYALLQLGLWYFRRSWWFVVLAAYYGILTVLRFLLSRYIHRRGIASDLPAQWRRSRVCAVILLLLNLFLSASVLMILYQGKGFDYPGIMIYVMALYAFYSVIHAVVDMVRFRKLGSPVLSTVKLVSFSSALVSMLSLETAMFHQFGADMARKDQKLMIILTGAGISILIITLAVLRIRRATIEIRRENHG